MILIMPVITRCGNIDV